MTQPKDLPITQPREMEQLQAVLEEVREIFSATNDTLTATLHKQVVSNALKCRRDGLSVLDLKIISRAIAEFRHAARVFKPYRGIRKVSIFGSARTPEGDAYFDMAVRFAQEMASLRFMVITGAAEGIMRAGNVGAGADRSFGVNILLPLEQSANRVLTGDPKLMTFKYFFTRKLFFLMEAHAVALFPGGFGTHDELFETLTLLQTGKNPPMPLVLMELPGDNYWESWERFIRDQLLKKELISPEDVNLYRICHSPEEAVDWILAFYSTYHSMRWVGSRLVLRLERKLPPGAVGRLSASFRDILARGTIEPSDALPEESDEPALAAKPRLVLHYNNSSAGRLVELIHEVNRLGAVRRERASA